MYDAGKKGYKYPQYSTAYNLNKERQTDLWNLYTFGKFYTASYGIPMFLVESEINCNLRLSGPELYEDFYPNVGDYISWTQEDTIPIGTDNKFIMSSVYRVPEKSFGTRTIPDTYNKEFYDCAYQRPNGVIWSRADVSENSMIDPWLIYKPLDYYEFPSENGKLIHMKGIESTMILSRFENQVAINNAIDVLKERLANSTELGSGGLFASRPMEYNKTDLGYTGTQSTEMVSNEFGHYWIDVKRANVFKVNPNGTGMEELTTGIRHWLREHLPFKILRYSIAKEEGAEGMKIMTYEDVDNKFAGLGLSLGWDNKYKRLFITKKDYIPVKPKEGYLYKEGKFYYGGEEVKLTDTEYFEDVSFTLAYSCIMNAWISYYSFHPDYYIEHLHHFQTGLNFSGDENEVGLWSHLLTNQSYQVFYGKLYPFLCETPVAEDYVKKRMSVFHYEMEARRYHSKIDWAARRDMGFNKCVIYNSTNTSGLLNLVQADKNDLRQKVGYPKTNADSRDILATEIDNRWNINDFFNVTIDDKNNVPLWVKDRNDIWRDVNLKAIRYDSMWNDRLRGDWFLIRLWNDIESRYKLIYKWNINEVKQYT